MQNNETEKLRTELIEFATAYQMMRGYQADHAKAATHATGSTDHRLINFKAECNVRKENAEKRLDEKAAEILKTVKK